MLNDVVFNGEISAYDDWNIVLTEAEIPLPEPKTMFVEIKGADGVIDLSEVLTDDIKFNNRLVKLKFEAVKNLDFNELITEIAQEIHGKIVTFSLSNDDDYFYVGRATINKWECIRTKGVIVITVDCEPYKYEVNETVVKVELSNETKNVTIENKRKRVCPTLIVSGNVTLTYKGESYQLIAGESQLLNFILDEGFSTPSFSGNGTVIIKFTKGAL